MNHFLTFHFKNGKLSITLLRQKGKEGDECVELLRDLIGLNPGLFEDKGGVIFYGNHPEDPEPIWDCFDLKFCTTKPRGHASEFLPFPHPTGLGEGAGIRRASDDGIISLLKSSSTWKTPKIFWDFDGTTTYREPLIKLSQQNQCWIALQESDEPEIRRSLESELDFVQEQVEYKYFLDLPKLGFSPRVKYLLATGRPVFLFERSCVEHWDADFLPWIHYIPVKYDFSDLYENYARIEASPELYDEISCNARAFVREHLLYVRQCEKSLRRTEQLMLERSSYVEKTLYSVVQLQPRFDAITVYDINIAVLIHYEGKYKRRLQFFKRLGIFNLRSHKIHLTLVGGQQDWDHREEILSGWPEGCTVTLLIVDSIRPLPKLNTYYLWQQSCGLRARWHLRVDDDSLTDVGGLVRFIDQRFRNGAVHIMTSPYFDGRGAELLIAYELNRGRSVPFVAHEHESSVTSDAAMKAMFAHPPSINFLRKTMSCLHHPGDLALAESMIIAGVPVATNTVSDKDMVRDEFSLSGGHLCHIHFVNWDDERFRRAVETQIYGKPSTCLPEVLSAFVDVPIQLEESLGVHLADIVLESDGTISNASSPVHARWLLSNNELCFARQDGIITAIFNTQITNFGEISLHGPELLGSKSLSLRLKPSVDSRQTHLCHAVN